MTFTYPGAGGPALQDVTLDVPPGALLAVTGPVGAGKSALARLVAGLYAPDSGQVPVDGVDPHGWRSSDRARVGYLPQGHPVFSGTIADNVILPTHERPIDHGRLHPALTVAALDHDIAGMPAGIDTGIGDQGVQLSGGQRGASPSRAAWPPRRRPAPARPRRPVLGP